MTNTLKHWPDVDSDDYGKATEVAIGLLSAAGYLYDDKDSAGNPVNEDLQTALMDVMFRSPGLMAILDAAESLASHAIMFHNSKMNSET